VQVFTGVCPVSEEPVDDNWINSLNPTLPDLTGTGPPPASEVHLVVPHAMPSFEESFGTFFIYFFL
jgi:hypothetical protein